MSFHVNCGHKSVYVEVEYPTAGFKPLAGLCSRGRERDKVDVPDACFSALGEMNVTWLQICEFIDPSTERIYDSDLPGDKGKLPKVFGLIPALGE